MLLVVDTVDLFAGHLPVISGSDGGPRASGAAPADGLGIAPDGPLIAGPDGGPIGRTALVHARRRSNAIIHAGNSLNVDMCHKTGEFFLAWGCPGPAS
jgi:hypothetical protein